VFPIIDLISIVATLEYMSDISKDASLVLESIYNSSEYSVEEKV
jgi:hypothetical protein